jgi:hypothetical protein
LLTGDTDAASNAFREELRWCRELVVPPFVTEGLLGLAGVAVVGGDADRAARLVGAAEAQRCEPEDPVEARLYATFFDPARMQYGPEAWDAAGRAGGVLSFEDAIAYALQKPSTQIGAHHDAAT